MADALCGPSNALQNFKSHTSADRSLQQDRIISRQQPGQNFRSHDPNTGILDPEFESFQAGQPTAFAGPAFPNYDSFQPFHHHAQNLHNVRPLQSGPSQALAPAPAWAADFQNLQIASPSPPQQHLLQKPVWTNQFQQGLGKSPASSAYASPGMQYQPGPSFGMNRTFMSSFQQPQFQPPVQESQVIQAQKDDFDEAAFEAAFDAAMEDAFPQPQHHPVEEPKQDEAGRLNGPDIYPHLPLIRLALLKAILDGRHLFLHEAALFVHQLARHDLDMMDPIQAMLLRPLISRLADQSRSPFAQRYDMVEQLEGLDVDFRAREKDAHITPENEQLLAAYADALWGRNQTNHLQDMHHDTSDTSYWRVSLEENMENWDSQNTTDQALKMLSESNLWALDTPESMNRLLDLEVQAYKSRTTSGDKEDLFSIPGSDDPQGLLFSMAQSLRNAPDVRAAEQAMIARHWENYRQDLEKLEAENKERHQLAMDELRKMQTSHDQPGELLRRSMHEHARQQHDSRSNMSGYLDQLDIFREQSQAHSAMSRQGVSDLDEQVQHSQEDLQPLEENTLQETQQEQDQPSQADDELAQTAAELLEKMSHEKSDKFKNSAFLGLMRKLADREVKVEGDKMVPTKSSQPITNQNPAAPTTWSQSGPMQTPSHQTLPTDGQDVVNLLNQPGPLFHDDEETTLPSDNQEDFDASFITDQGMSAPASTSTAPSLTPESSSQYPSWTWADRY